MLMCYLMDTDMIIAALQRAHRRQNAGGYAAFSSSRRIVSPISRVDTEAVFGCRISAVRVPPVVPIWRGDRPQRPNARRSRKRIGRDRLFQLRDQRRFLGIVEFNGGKHGRPTRSATMMGHVLRSPVRVHDFGRPVGIDHHHAVIV
jgi:hypothetical protein